MYFDNIETIELQDQLSRHEAKKNINRSDAEFQNLIDKIDERGIRSEMARAALLLQKFGDVRYTQMTGEENPHKKQSLYPGILHFYNQAIALGKGLVNVEEMQKKVGELNKKTPG